MKCLYCVNHHFEGCGYIYLGHNATTHFICAPCLKKRTDEASIELKEQFNEAIRLAEQWKSFGLKCARLNYEEACKFDWPAEYWPLWWPKK